MSAVKIQRLALPKGVSLKCEICSEPVAFRCSECPTYYCTREHFETDWYGVLHEIHQDVAELREVSKNVGTEKDRQQREKELISIRRKILEISRATAQKFVVQGQYVLAIAGALQALRMSEALYGTDSMEVVSSQLLLAEVHLGLQRLQSAEELLTLVNWSLFKHPEAGQRMRPHLCRNIGRLYSAQKRYDEALNAFALAIYHAACEHGPESFRTAPSYFYMAQAFRESKKSNNEAIRFYAKVCDIYFKWFDTVYVRSSQPGDVQPSLGDRHIDEIEIQEAIEIMQHIQQQAEEILGRDHRRTSDARAALGLLQAHAKEFVPAIENLEAAVQAMKESLGEKHHLTIQRAKQLAIVSSIDASHKKARNQRAF